MKIFRLFSSLCVAGSLALVVAGASANKAEQQPENFVNWRSGLVSSAQPKAVFLAQLKEQHYEVLINLAPPQSMGSLENEGGIVGRQGLAYVNIPVDFSHPTLQDFELFSDIMKAAQGKQVYVHCQANFRGSSFVFLYRVIHEGASAQEAAAKLNTVWVPDTVWKKFIQQTLAHYGKADEIF
jgi:protein tyrosine phosphatase (PTP) superfamily phosphohydrolase (DUF442 family)